MNPSLSRRMIGFLFVFLIAMAGCVDYQEPTGPVPAPEPDSGDADASAARIDSVGLAP